MAWYEDLAPCDYFGAEFADDLSAVGWLSASMPYTQGPVSEKAFLKLCALLRRPWMPMSFCGYHSCELCRFTGGEGAEICMADGTRLSVSGHSLANLFVPGVGTLYVAPESITHYMDAHGYQPPQKFLEAVMECPRMSSAEYFRAVRASGGEFAARTTRVGHRTR